MGVRFLKLGTEGEDVEASNTDLSIGGGIDFNASGTFLLERVGDVIKTTYPDYSFKVNYSGENISNVEYYSTATQIVANRRVTDALTYTGDNVTSRSISIYDPADGTTVLRTISETYTYTGDLISSVTVSEA